MKTTFQLPAEDRYVEGMDIAKLRVGDEVRVIIPADRRWCGAGMHCIVRAKNADGSIEVERVR